ncbi:MAG TPA: efflux RND transporter periplasmic adaptor subunit, partial [Planctomycetota bacterium]|nr:efflux RND transporter periplasmic adaptor subunit [Planctomycetota bacterium]
MNTPKGSLAGLFLLAFGAVGGWSLHRWLGPAPATATENSGEATPVETQVRVRVAKVHQADLPLVVKAVGTAEADPMAVQTVASRAGGIVDKVFVLPGAKIAQGQALLTFDPTPWMAQLAEAQATRDQAAGDLAEWERTGRFERTQALEADVRTSANQVTLAQAQVQRLEPLLAKGLIASKTVTEAQLAADLAVADNQQAADLLAGWNQGGAELRRKTLQAGLAAAEARLKDAEALSEAVQVLAPAEGLLLSLDARVGMRLDPGAVLATLQVSGERRIAFGIDPQWVDQIPEQAAVTWWDAQGQPQPGRVVARVPGVDPQTGMVRVWVRPTEAASALEPGLVVHGELEYRRLTAATLVPEQAVIRSSDATAVVVIDGQNIAHIVPVSVLGRHAGSVAVEGTLANGAL